MLPGPQMDTNETQMNTIVKIRVHLWLKPWTEPVFRHTRAVANGDGRDRVLVIR